VPRPVPPLFEPEPEPDEPAPVVPPVPATVPPPVALVPPEVEPPEVEPPEVGPPEVEPPEVGPPEPVEPVAPLVAPEEPPLAPEVPLDAGAELAGVAAGAVTVDPEALVDVVEAWVVDGGAALVAAPFGTVRVGPLKRSTVAVAPPPPHAARPTARASALISAANVKS
jgi:hypothetical protein